MPRGIEFLCFRSSVSILVCLFLRPSITLVELLCQSFVLKFLKWVYLSNHSSESIHTWAMGTLEGLLTFHKFWSQGSCPRVGLGIKIWDTLKSV